MVEQYQMEAAPILTEPTWRHCQAMEINLFHKDIAGKMDEPDLRKSNADVNLGLTKCTSFTSESKVVNLIGRLRGDTSLSRKILVGNSKSASEATSQ